VYFERATREKQPASGVQFLDSFHGRCPLSDSFSPPARSHLNKPLPPAPRALFLDFFWSFASTPVDVFLGFLLPSHQRMCDVSAGMPQLPLSTLAGVASLVAHGGGSTPTPGKSCSQHDTPAPPPGPKRRPSLVPQRQGPDLLEGLDEPSPAFFVGHTLWPPVFSPCPPLPSVPSLSSLGRCPAHARIRVST